MGAEDPLKTYWKEDKGLVLLSICRKGLCIFGFRGKKKKRKNGNGREGRGSESR
jgi:hypothetical protein